jgi:hypothetical protein
MAVFGVFYFYLFANISVEIAMDIGQQVDKEVI